MPDRVTFVICILYSAWVCNLMSSVTSRPICANNPYANKVQYMEVDSGRIINELKNLTEYRNLYNETKTNSSDDIDKLEELVKNFSESVDDQRKRMSELKGRLSVEQRNANQSMEWQEVQLEEYKRRVNNLESDWRYRALNKSQLSTDWATLGAKAKKLASVQNQTRMSRTDLEGNLQNSERELTQMKDEVENLQNYSLKDEEEDTGAQQEIIEQSMNIQDALEEVLKKLKKDLEELLPKKVEVVENDVSKLCRRHGLD